MQMVPYKGAGQLPVNPSGSQITACMSDWERWAVQANAGLHMSARHSTSSVLITCFPESVVMSPQRCRLKRPAHNFLIISYITSCCLAVLQPSKSVPQGSIRDQGPYIYVRECRHPLESGVCHSPCSRCTTPKSQRLSKCTALCSSRCR